MISRFFLSLCVELKINLKRLVQFSTELINDWYGFLPSQDAWRSKFEINAARMEANFKRGNQRCGFFDPNLEHGGPPPAERRRREADEERYNRADPVEGERTLHYFSQIKLQAQEKLQLVSENGPSAIYPCALDRKSTSIKSTE